MLWSERITEFGFRNFVRQQIDQTTSSTIFNLCFGGFRRLSGITRAGGGLPAESRARRRASFDAENFLRFFFMTHPLPSLSSLRINKLPTTADCPVSRSTRE